MAAAIGAFLLAILTVLVNNAGITSAQVCPLTWEDGALIPGFTNLFYPVDLDNDMETTTTNEEITLALEAISVFDTGPYNSIGVSIYDTIQL